MNSKHCPYCHFSTKVIKFGKTSSMRQRYRCGNCKKSWTNKARSSRRAAQIWHDYVWNNAPVRVLADKYHKSPNAIRTILNSYEPTPLSIAKLSPSRKAATKVIVLDTTYFGRREGVVTVLDAHTGRLLYFHPIIGSESNTEYFRAVCAIEDAGIYPKACVIDGRTGLAELLEEKGYLVQLCHFHMWQIVRRYLTNRPVLEPNIELKLIIDNFLNRHIKTTRFSFAAQMNSWRSRNLIWLNEWHYDDNHHKEYAHDDTRRAFRAIKRHFPWLFTYEKYPELNIPKTSNLIEGKFGNAKDKLKLHHGYTHRLKIKIFFSLLSGE